MKRGKFWKYFLAFCALSLLSLPAFSESETELEVPDLEPTEEYVMAGQDIMTLYQTINELNETKTEYQNLTDEMMETLKDAQILLNEYAEENKKLIIKNKILFGTTVVSVSFVATGLLSYILLNNTN